MNLEKQLHAVTAFFMLIKKKNNQICHSQADLSKGEPSPGEG